MSTSILPLSTVINVSVNSAPTLLPTPNLNTIAIITQDNTPSTWSSGQAFAIYQDPVSLANDFGLNSNTYAIGSAAFAQSPSFLGASGYLVVIPRLQSPSLESVEAAIQRTMDLVYYFGVVIDQELADSSPTVFQSLANYIQTIDKMFFYTSSNVNDTNSGSPLDLVTEASDNQTRCFYYGSPLLNGAGVQQTQIFSSAYAGRMLSVDFLGANTTLTDNLKRLSTITPDATLTSTIASNAKAIGVDVYANISGIPGILSSGANSFFDSVYNREWLKFQLQTDLFNALSAVGTKIPMTEPGMYALKGVVIQDMQIAVNNQYIAPGTWPSSAKVFGNANDLVRNIADFGFYVYSSPISQMTQAQLQSRQAPLIQVAALEAGAIHSVVVNVQIAL